MATGKQRSFIDNDNYRELSKPFESQDAARVAAELALAPSLLHQFEQNCDRLFVKPPDHQGKLIHASMGLAGEGGELLDAVKKHAFYGKSLDLENVLEECGDALFYVAVMLKHCGFTMEQAMQHNMAKLNKRYPEGYTDAAAQARADKADEKAE